MTNNAAIQAVYWDYKRVPTRNSFQIICEVPIEQAAQVHKILGQPNPKESMWVAIAKLDPSAVEIGDDEAPVVPKKEKRKWEDLKPSQQAGIRCAEPLFQTWLSETIKQSNRVDEKVAAEIVCMECVVESRSELNTNLFARRAWQKMDHNFIVWKDTPEL